jgi:DNA-binding transcriptional LysR family regulator
VGASVRACQQLLLRVFSELRERSPRLPLQAHSRDKPDLVEWLRETRIDLAACIEPRAAADLEIRPLFKDELLLALSPGHPWGDGRPVSSE